MKTFSLPELLEAAGRRMREDLRQRFVGHPGEEGSGREEIVRQFLGVYLPKRFEVSAGFAFDSAGSRSKQLDLIVADALVCPRFETPGGTRFYPCEGIVAVGQIRSAVTSRKAFHDALDNLESVKKLDRSANGIAVDRVHHEALNNRAAYLHQIFSFLLVTGKSLAAVTAHQEFLRYLEDREPYLWPNLVLALDKYLITHCCDDGVCPNPMHSRGIALEEGDSAADLIMRFYVLLGRAIEVTRVAGFPHWEYLHHARKWNAQVLHAATGPDETPPLLGSAFRR